MNGISHYDPARFLRFTGYNSFIIIFLYYIVIKPIIFVFSCIIWFVYKVYLRALFDYTPFEDKATPCQEAGLPFLQGDILQVVSQDDPTWWQAKRVGDGNLRAGLIPSKHFQQRCALLYMNFGYHCEI